MLVPQRGQFALISRKIFPRTNNSFFSNLWKSQRKYSKRFSVNDPNVTLHTYAIGREKTTATIHVTKDDESSSAPPITKRQTNMFPGATEKETRRVTVLPLSQVLQTMSIPQTSLLKVDVQGYELDVLIGSEDILDKFSYLYIECSFVELYEGQALAGEIISWLNQREFALSSVHNIYYEKDGNAVQGDFLFTNLSKMA